MIMYKFYWNKNIVYFFSPLSFKRSSINLVIYNLYQTVTQKHLSRIHKKKLWETVFISLVPTSVPQNRLSQWTLLGRVMIFHIPMLFKSLCSNHLTPDRIPGILQGLWTGMTEFIIYIILYFYFILKYFTYLSANVSLKNSIAVTI